MPPAPLPLNEHERLAALRATEVLDTPPEPAFDNLTALVARLCDVPIALVSLVDEKRQWFKSTIGLPVCQTPRDQAFCGYTILGNGPLVVENAALDRRFFDNPLVTGSPGIRFYAGVPLRCAKGHPLGSLCVIDTRPRGLNATQTADLLALAGQAEAQLRLRRSIKELKAAHETMRSVNAAKSLFVATMSHEIRTPLTGILGFLDLLLDEPAPEVRQDYATTVRRSVDLLMNVLNDALDLSKIESGKLTVERASCNPARKLVDMERLFAPRARDKGLEFRVLTQTPIPTTFVSDPLRIRQVLSNLLTNAIKFTPQGEVTLAASWEDGVLAFEVSDSGIGMTQEQQASVFTPFSQAEHDTWKRFGGTGLGLSISRKLAELLGGSLTVRSSLGMGSTFRFELPAALGPGVELIESWRSAAMQGGQPELARLDGRRILVVEDGADNQRLIRAFLERAGARVQCVADGRTGVQTALAGADGEPFDLVLMDVQLPGMDGHEAAQTLRRNGFATPIICISASALETDREAALAAGCDDLLPKPFNRATFLSVCSGWCAKRQARAASLAA